MGFSIFCDNKGCGERMEPILDINTNEAICTECNKPIKSVTQFTKSQMRALGQVKRAIESRQAFVVECTFCRTKASPTIKDKKIYCSGCGKHMDNLSAPFVQSLLQNVSSSER